MGFEFAFADRRRAPLPSRAMTRPASSTPPPIPIPVEELDRRLKWGFIPIVVFAGTILALAIVAVLSVLRTPPLTVGLPADTDVIAARALVAGRFPPPPGAFQFEAMLLGDPAPAGSLTEETLHRAARAESLLERASARHPLDGRLPASLASLDVVRGAYTHAARRYQHALDLAPHYPEARLGFGVALALGAEELTNALERRGARLKALGQLAEVRDGQPGATAALYDRAWLLAEVGRTAEARASAALYFARDSVSAEARALAAQLAEHAH